MYALLGLIDAVISLVIWMLIISAVLSWLVQFNVVNRHNSFVAAVMDFLWRVTEPMLRPVRRVVPLVGGVDLSPVVLILVLWFLRNLILVDFAPAYLK
jgi:YggT family protein